MARGDGSSRNQGADDTVAKASSFAGPYTVAKASSFAEGYGGQDGALDGGQVGALDGGTRWRTIT
jgi:hypothetical protein